MNGCVVNLNEKGTKTYLNVQFNSPVYSREMAIHGQIIIVLMDSGFNRETLESNYFTSGSGVIVQSITIPMAKAE